MTHDLWVILLTDRRRLGAPIRLVARGDPRTPTERPDDADTFHSRTAARGWWSYHADKYALDARFVPSFVPASELSPTGKVSP